jgi:hypothetical protein
MWMGAVAGLVLLATGCTAPAAPTSAAQPAAATPAPVSAAPVPASGPDPAAIIEVPPPAPPAPAPVGVDLPPIGTVPIVPSGVSADGVAEIPEDIGTAGWYRFGAAPGDPVGMTVLMGHRDGDGGRGALFRLAEVPVGSVVTVQDAAGAPHRYRVASNESISKRVVPLADLFDRTGPRGLVVISCGGAYDRQAGGYQDNVVLRAVPA